LFGDDVHGSGEGSLGTGQLWDFGGLGGCLLFETGQGRLLSPDQLSQVTQTQGPGNGSARFALGPVGAVEILQPSQRVCSRNLCEQLRVGYTLLTEQANDIRPARLKIAQGLQLLSKSTQDLVIKITSDFFAITGNERDRCTIVNQGDDSVDLAGLEVEG